MTHGKNEEAVEIRGVRLTHPDRVMFPRQGATKRAVAEYFADNAERLLEFVKGRPVSLVRCPSGRDEECFFQKHFTSSTPEHLKSVEIKEKSGKKSPYLVIDSIKGLVAAAQIGALELHVWGARADRIERPERMVFDLDPDTSLGFAAVREAAFEVRERLAAADIESFALLTGGKGVHVIAPLERRAGWSEVKTFAKALAGRLAKDAPDRFVASAPKEKRKGKTFIDWLRNERGATAIAPYSLRARAGAPVATPVTWRELSNIDRADAYTLDNIRARLSHLRNDPWEGYGDVRQSITKAAIESVV